MQKNDSLIFPGDESAPKPRIGYRATFIDHLIRGLSTPILEFLRGLLFVYGIQLHQLTPNSILHISLFITLCECFLGTHPHWGMWKRIFYVRRNNSRSVVYNVGGACICVRPDIYYFDVKFPDSIQGWCKRWLYTKDESVGNQEYDIAPFYSATKIITRFGTSKSRRKAATDALMKRIHQLQNTHGEELSGIQITSYFLRIRVKPLQARKNPLWMYAGEEDVDRISKDLAVKDLEKLIRRFSSLSKKDEVPTSCRVEPYSGSHPLPKALGKANKHADDLAIKLEQSEKAREKAEQDASSIGDLRKRLHHAENALSKKTTQRIAREEAIIGHLESQNRRFVTKMGEDFTLHEPEEDRLLDSLSILELRGDLARSSIADARAAFTRLSMTR
ncbi:hypothetical protein QYE76_067758 [Lolium multiflorum]|uniref:Transposase (putative) gypsy type domain-containing protein n=1 Tax=Lolium multiflorum TaxID=4521 RepID=A0AAD8WB97_LOLMU|nr:hypothetical protein QYE76_067758 [Lolium multiflorum]